MTNIINFVFVWIFVSVMQYYFVRVIHKLNYNTQLFILEKRGLNKNG